MSKTEAQTTIGRGNQSEEFYRLFLEDMGNKRFIYENGWNVVENIRKLSEDNDRRKGSLNPRCLLDSVKDYQGYEVGEFLEFIDSLDQANILDKRRKGLVGINEEAVEEKLDEELLQYLKRERIDRHVKDSSVDYYDVSHYIEKEGFDLEYLRLLTSMSEAMYENNIETSSLVRDLSDILEEDYELEGINDVKVRKELSFFHDLGFLDEETGLSDEEYFTVSRGIEEIAQQRYVNRNC